MATEAREGALPEVEIQRRNQWREGLIAEGTFVGSILDQL